MNVAPKNPYLLNGKDYYMTKGLTLLLLCGSLLLSGEKRPRDWHDAKVVDTAYAYKLDGFDVSSQAYGDHQSSSSRANYRRYQECAFDDGKYIYITSERLHWHREGAQLIVNGNARIAVDHGKLYILDSAGKEHTTRIVKQIARTSN